MLDAPPGPRPEPCAPIADAVHPLPPAVTSQALRAEARWARTAPKHGSSPGGNGSASPPKQCRQCGEPLRGLPRSESPAEPNGCPLEPGHLRRPSPAETSSGGLLTEVRRGRSGSKTWTGSGVDRAPAEACAFAASVPLDGRTPECAPSRAALPPTSVLTTIRPGPGRCGSDADRLQGVAPPTSP
jgi:hypothetical protein